MLDARTVLYKTYLKLDNAVKGLVRVDPICRRLMSIPGVGPVTALTFKAVVDDPNRFKSSRAVAAHFGLTPRRFQSGELATRDISPERAMPMFALRSTSPLTRS